MDARCMSAVALVARVDLFVTADRRQAQVARGLGQTELVNGDPLPGGLVTNTRVIVVGGGHCRHRGGAAAALMGARPCC